MEQRREPRIETDQDVTVTVLSSNPQTTMPGKAVDLSGRGLRLHLPMHVPPDSALRIEMGDRTLLGEVAYSMGGPVQWKVGVEVEQVLVFTPQLEQLNRSLRRGDFDGRDVGDGGESERRHSFAASPRQADVTMKVTSHGNREAGAEEDRKPAAHALSPES